MTERVDAVVIGAGVVGLACARALANAGIYYPAGSLKANLCVAGRKQLYDFCEEDGVAHSRCGKLIVGTSAEQNAKLADIRRLAVANGVNDLCFLTAAGAMALSALINRSPIL